MPRFQKVAPPEPRVVRLATVHYQPRDGATPADKRKQFEPLIAEAGEKKADLVVLPEGDMPYRLATAEDLRAAGIDIPLLVGGTFLYFRALEHGLSDMPPADPAVRAELEQELLHYLNRVEGKTYRPLLSGSPPGAQHARARDN